ncbi:Protein of unknown function [Anaerovirgula multivorans]|uniref:DUF1576 domain-containing protein n=1 Tax=Anaerovirgula multivorans TaxID=312168 RepID=A0A239EEN9_9FIRM|nr:DUF1576 domain-containing protein [Anaerovirgula multivorans]SNS42352.1 Protein of unknown function [Anaerovirgula multivorans]
MSKSIGREEQATQERSEKMHKKAIEVSEKVKFRVISIYAVFVLISAFIFNSPYEIMTGMMHIIVAPSILITDYMAVGNIGAALFNSGILMLLAIFITKKCKVNMNGPIIAAIFTIGGFALFGKNLYNVWGIFLGVYLFSVVQKEKFSKFILIAFFGTALGPLISQVTFDLGFTIINGLILGNIIGVIAGFILPPLANHFIKFHQGFNLYNMGFTAGMVGTVFMALFRAFDLQTAPTLILLEGYNRVLGMYLFLIFTSMIIVGLMFNNRSFSGYRRLLKYSGRLVADYVNLSGFGLSFINMGLLGMVTTLYVLLVNGQLNGPIIGGIFTVVGFGAFGKHIRNITPILLGVYLASLFKIWDTNAIGPLLAALFGTTLAPIAGEFGAISGIVAGFLHMAMVMNVGYLHGGMNLYNNGFAGGMVAAVLLPIIDSFKKEEE